MKSQTSYFTIKAYLPTGQLIKSKPLLITQYWEYMYLISDCRILGCKGYYLTDATGNRYIHLKEYSYPLISLESIKSGCKC